MTKLDDEWSNVCMQASAQWCISAIIFVGTYVRVYIQAIELATCVLPPYKAPANKICICICVPTQCLVILHWCGGQQPCQPTQWQWTYVVVANRISVPDAKGLLPFWYSGIWLVSICFDAHLTSSRPYSWAFVSRTILDFSRLFHFGCWLLFLFLLLRFPSFFCCPPLNSITQIDPNSNPFSASTHIAGLPLPVCDATPT